MNRTGQVQSGHPICSWSEAGQGRHRPPRCAGPGNLIVGITARTWFVATLTFALVACGGGPGMGQGPPLISAFTASPTDRVTGHRITLSWTVAGATNLSISGVGAVTGSSTDVDPTTDTDYVLTAKNAAGTATHHVQVTIYPPPVNWFAPFPHNTPGDPGVLDFFALFDAGAPWDAYRVRRSGHTQTLSASGGRPPYLWVASGLPPGIELLSTGLLQGSPSSAGNYTVDVTAIDDATPSGIAQPRLALTVQ